MFILWFSTGLWHGGSWNFIIGSGLLHWFYIVGGQVLEPVFKKLTVLFTINTDCFSWHLFQSLRTFFLVCVGFVFFRADSFRDGLMMCRAVFTFDMNVFSVTNFTALGLDVPDTVVAMISLLVLL